MVLPEACEWRVESGASVISGNGGEEGGGESYKVRMTPHFHTRASERWHIDVRGWALSGVTLGNSSEHSLQARLEEVTPPILKEQPGR